MPKVDPITAMADLARRWRAFGDVSFPHKPRHGFEALTTPDALYAALSEVDQLRAEAVSLNAWKASSLALWAAADERLRPLVQDVPGALGRDIYEVAAEEIIHLRAKVAEQKFHIQQMRLVDMDGAL